MATDVQVRTDLLIGELGTQMFEPHTALESEPSARPLILSVQGRHALRHELPHVMVAEHRQLRGRPVQERVGQLAVVEKFTPNESL